MFGSGLDFDGASGQVKVADNLALEPNSTVTVSAWIKHAGSPGLLSIRPRQGRQRLHRRVLRSVLRARRRPGVLRVQGPWHHLRTSPTPASTSGTATWHLAVGTYDGTTIRLYVDGNQVGSGTSWGGSLEYLLPSSNDFYIGNYPGCADHEFLGSIDDVRVWNRTLSASEISGLVPPAGPPGQPTSPSGGSGAGSGGTGGTGGTPTGGGGSTGTAKGSTAAPSISGVKLSSPVVTVDPQGHVISHSASGLSLTYVESQAGSLKVTLLRSEKGVRHGKRCVAPSRRAKGRSCTHFVVLSSVVRSGQAGRLTVPFNQLFHRRLSPGTYRLDVTPRAEGHGRQDGERDPDGAALAHVTAERAARRLSPPRGGGTTAARWSAEAAAAP